MEHNVKLYWYDKKTGLFDHVECVTHGKTAKHISLLPCANFPADSINLIIEPERAKRGF